MKTKAIIITFGCLILIINVVGLSLIYQSYSKVENNFDDLQKFVGEWYKIASPLKEIKSYIFTTKP